MYISGNIVSAIKNVFTILISNPCLNQTIHFQLEYSVYLLSIDQVSFPWIWGLKPQILLHQHNLFQYLKCSNFLACFVQHCWHLWSDFSMMMTHSCDSNSESWVKLRQKSLQINLELRNCDLRKNLVLKKEIYRISLINVLPWIMSPLE